MQVEADSVQIREDGDVVFITLPPSQYSRTITVTKGPQTATRVYVTEDLSQQLPTRPNTSAINATPDRVAPSPHNECSTYTRGTSVPILSNSTADVSSINFDALNLGSHVNALENTPSSPDLHNLTPSHLRGRPFRDRFRVSKEVLKQYPPFYVGWKKPSWVVVIRGRDIGIFHDFWARIWPLIKFTEENIIPGASWKKAESEDDAFSKWALAVEQGVTDRIF